MKLVKIEISAEEALTILGSENANNVFYMLYEHG